jgi:hypothetical protein
VRTRLRLLAVILCFLAAAVIAALTLGGKIGDRMFQPWTAFRIPPGAAPLNAEITIDGRTITLCNRTPQKWRDISVQIEGAYVLKLSRLGPSECRDIHTQQFAYPSWKRLPPPNNLIVHKVEVLAAIESGGPCCHLKDSAIQLGHFERLRTVRSRSKGVNYGVTAAPRHAANT